MIQLIGFLKSYVVLSRFLLPYYLYEFFAQVIVNLIPSLAYLFAAPLRNKPLNYEDNSLKHMPFDWIPPKSLKYRITKKIRHDVILRDKKLTAFLRFAGIITR